MNFFGKLLFVVLFSVVIFESPLSLLSMLLLTVAAGALLFVLAYFVFAPYNLFFTNVKEGTFKAVMKGGAFAYGLIQWKGHTLDREQNVIEETPMRKEPWHPFGGLRFYGFWPVYRIYTYNFEKWVGVSEDGEKLEDHAAESVDYISLKDHVYGLELTKAEDTKGLPLSWKEALTARVLNPYRALFVAQKWYKILITRISPYIRDFSGTISFEQLTADPKGLSEFVDQKIDARIRSDKVEDYPNILELFKKRYGVDIRRIETIDVNPPEEFRRDTIKQYLGEQESRMQSEETAGRILRMVAIAMGMTVEELQKDLKDNPQKRGMWAKDGGYKDAFAYAEDQVKRDRAAAEGDLRDIRIANADGTSFQDQAIGLLIGGVAAAASQFGKSGGGKSKSGGKSFGSNPTSGSGQQGGKPNQGGLKSTAGEDML